MTAFWDKFLSLDKRIIYVFMLLAMAIPLFLPFGLPISVSPLVQEVYDLIDSLDEGALVFIAPEINPQQEPEMAPMLRSLVRHLLQRKARIVFGGFIAQGTTLAQKYTQEVFDQFGAVYGVDYVNLGPRGYLDATLDSARFNFVGAFANRDINNTPLTDFPLMVDLHTASDFSLVIAMDVGEPSISNYIAAWRATGSVQRMIGVCTAANIPGQQVNYNSGLLVGLLGGMSAAAQYETVLGIPDSATRGIAAQGISHLVIVLFVVLGNIGHFAIKKNKSKEG